MRQAADSLAAGRGSLPDRTGTVIAGRFRLEALIAREGGTEVYQAIDGTTGTPHAVRLVPLSAIAGTPERLLAEVEKTQALRHKNLVEVEAAGIDGEVVFVAAELIDGQTLREFIDAKRAEGQGTSLKGACNLVAHVANALDYASRVGRHGALNPAIIWVNRAGRVRVSGLGIGGAVPAFARHGAPKGAPDTLYMAPEIVAGGPPKAAADVFSLGMIFYELLTGRPPATPYQPPSQSVPDVPASVDQAVARAISAVPEDRWPTPTAFKDALQQAGGPPAAATQTHGAGDQRPAGEPGGLSVPIAGAPRTTSVPAPHSDGSGPAPGVGLGLGGFGRAARGGGLPAGAPPSPGQRFETSSAPAATGSASSVANAGSGLSGAAAAPGSAASPIGLGLGGAPPRPTREGGSGLIALPPAGPPSPEDLVERWLIHKENLDFGPFSMVQIRAQIERGEIQAEHLIIDNETGTKSRVRDVPGLGAMAKNAHRRLEQTRRAQAEQRHEKTEKKKSMLTGIIVAAVLLVLAGGATIFLLSRHDTSGGKLASREEEAEIENFLKGVKIGGMKATVHRAPPGGHRAGGSLSGGSAEDFNNDANFGDVGKGFYQGDQTLDDDQIQSTMMANYRKLIPCIVHAPVSNIALEFAVRGNGKVSAVKVNGQRTGALPGCMLSRMQSFNFPKFNGNKTIASWSMSMGH
jgi:serine/threonine protein kinase